MTPSYEIRRMERSRSFVRSSGRSIGWFLANVKLFGRFSKYNRIEKMDQLPLMAGRIAKTLTNAEQTRRVHIVQRAGGLYGLREETRIYDLDEATWSPIWV